MKEKYFRRLKENNLHRTKKNGRMEKRDWLVYSETSKSVFFCACKLFPQCNKGKQSFVEGLSNWKSLYPDY